MKLKTFSQLNDERAGWRAHLKRRSRVFKENQKRAKAASLQAGGPAPVGFKNFKYYLKKPASAKILTTEEYKILWDKYSVKKRS